MILRGASHTTSTGQFVLTTAELKINENSILSLNGTETIAAQTIRIENNSLLTHAPQGNLLVSVPNLIIDVTSAISADGLGYPSDQGPGTGLSTSGGAGYGGIGGTNYGELGGPLYGSALYPTDLGSGGAYGQGGGDPYGGTGGGAIRLTISDTLTLNGKISANSVQGAYRGGGGSGGSIYITADKFEGSGALQINGANSSDAGGGGGRIAVYYNESTFGGSAHDIRRNRGTDTMDLQPDRTERLFLLIQK